MRQDRLPRALSHASRLRHVVGDQPQERQIIIGRRRRQAQLSPEEDGELRAATEEPEEEQARPSSAALPGQERQRRTEVDLRLIITIVAGEAATS